MNIPKELKYTEEHEWIRIDGNTATIGITDFAQGELGDVVFVELPNIGDVFVATGDKEIFEEVNKKGGKFKPKSEKFNPDAIVQEHHD